MKRPNANVNVDGASKKAKVDFSNSNFSFNFESQNEEKRITNDSTKSEEYILENYPSSKVGRLNCRFEDVFSGILIEKDDLVLIEWEESNFFSLKCKLLSIREEIKEESSIFVSPSKVDLLFNKRDKDAKICNGLVDNELLYHLDPIMSKGKITSAPLSIETGLASFIFPIDEDFFKTKIFKHKAFVSHSCGSRLDSIKEELFNFDVKSLVQNSERTIVWVRNKITNQMQYLESPSETALPMYYGGHSLYLSPSNDIQRKYILPLALDLGMDFSTFFDDNFGGDIEIFAVQGKHYTPWHFDGQENFTIQLKGTKKWKVKKGVINPITNFHPFSSSKDQVKNDLKLHSSYVTNSDLLHIPNEKEDHIETFILRPGSVLYLPKGMWHSVEAEDEGGSLSINFSMISSKYSDFVVNRFLSFLNSRNSFRDGIIINSREETIKHLDSMIIEMKEMINSLSAESFLPNNLFYNNKCDFFVIGGECKKEDVIKYGWNLDDGLLNTAEAAKQINLLETEHLNLKRNKLFTTLCIENGRCEIHSGFANATYKSEYLVNVYFPCSLKFVLEALVLNNINSIVTLDFLLSELHEKSNRGEVFQLVSVLIYTGAILIEK